MNKDGLPRVDIDQSMQAGVDDDANSDDLKKKELALKRVVTKVSVRLKASF